MMSFSTKVLIPTVPMDVLHRTNFQKCNISFIRRSKRLVKFSEKPDVVIWEPAELVPLLKEVPTPKKNLNKPPIN